MRIFTKCILLFILAGNLSAQTPSFAWAKSFGGNNNDFGRQTCVDASGNVYVLGDYNAPSMVIGSITLNSAGGNDIYLSKFDPNGNLVWAQSIGGSANEWVGGVCTSTNGNVYVTGSFNSSVLTVGTATLGISNIGTNRDIFVAAFTNSGTFRWAYSYGNTGDDVAKGVTYSNATGRLIFTGNYRSSTLAFGSTTLTNTGTNDEIFVTQLNVSVFSASVFSAFTTGHSNSADIGYTVKADASGILIGGTFFPLTGSVSTIGASVSTQGSQDVFLAKYTNNNVFQWVKTGGSVSVDYLGGMNTDASGNCYIAGSYVGGPMVLSTTTLTGSGSWNGFIAKYNTSGTVLWANKLGGAGDALNTDITLDANSDAYVSGYYTGTVVSSGTVSLNNTSLTNGQYSYVVKYNANGASIWGNQGITDGYSEAASITNDAVGNLYITGSYSISKPISFGSTTLTSTGNMDTYLVKIGCLGTNITGVSSVCQGNSATLTANGATSYTWSTGATTSSIIVTPTANTSYTLIGNTGSCTASNSTPFVLTYLPASAYPGSNLSLLCKQKAQLTATCSPTAASVTWSPATNLSSASVLTPSVTGGVGNTTYTMSVTLTNGCIKTGTVNVSSYAQTPNICQVTVDSLSVNNEIYWEKALYPQADSFIVYRETSTNVYTRIAGIPRTAFSMYVDTNRSIGPANGDPNLTYYKYKLRIKDSCGNISPFSLWHETIFIQDQLNGNFNWNQYAIESATSTPVSIYNLKRRTIATGTETLVTSTTGGLATDPAYNSFWPLNVKWLVDAVGFNCNPTAKTMVLKTKTKSNQSNDKIALGIKGYDLSNVIKIYPNPTHDYINVDLNSLSKTEIIVEIKDMLGQTIYTTKSLNQYLNINVNSLAEGVYMITVIQNDRTIAAEKVVID